MNWNIVEGSWKQLKGRVRMSWASLMGKPHDLAAARRVEMAGREQKNYGVEKDLADEQMKRFAVRMKRSNSKGAT